MILDSQEEFYLACTLRMADNERDAAGWQRPFGLRECRR